MPHPLDKLFNLLSRPLQSLPETLATRKKAESEARKLSQSDVICGDLVLPIAAEFGRQCVAATSAYETNNLLFFYLMDFTSLCLCDRPHVHAKFMSRRNRYLRSCVGFHLLSQANQMYKTPIYGDVYKILNSILDLRGCAWLVCVTWGYLLWV